MDDLCIPRKLELWELAILSRVPPARRAIERITSGVLNMRWAIVPPNHLRTDKGAYEIAERLEETLRNLNGSDGGIDVLLAAVTRDLLLQSAAVIQRLPAEEDRLFGAVAIPLWEVIEGERPLPADTFAIYGSSDSDGNLLPSPLGRAARATTAWVELFERRRRVAGLNRPNILFDIDSPTEAEFELFRAYLDLDDGAIKTIGGKDIKVLNLNPENETEFLFKHEESLIREIAMSFGLPPREIGITIADRQETVGFSVKSAFEGAILPIARKIYRRIEVELVGYFHPGYRLLLNESEPRTQTQQVKLAVLLWNKGVITLNQALISAGYDSIGPEGEYRKPTH